MGIKHFVFGLCGAVTLAVTLAGSSTNLSPRTSAAPKTETAILAGGCFWGLQETLRHIPGVIKTTVGYAGGTVPNPTYELVCTRKTGHMEAVRVVFDPTKLSYEHLVSFLLGVEAPGNRDQPKNYIHSPSRFTIFYTSDDQRQTAERVKQAMCKTGAGKQPATAITNASTFYPAEEYHQDYYQKNRVGYICQ